MGTAIGERRAVVVTGVSSGIGAAIARDLATQGFRVFGTVRKVEDAERLESEFGGAVTPVVMDVCDPVSVSAAAELVAEELHGRTLAGLVNNAGVCLPGATLELPLSDWEYQLRVNVLGPVAAIQAFGPLLGVDQERKGPPGRIVNISSVSGKIAVPFLGAYAASKFALEALSESLRRELRIFGIHVVVVGPGNVKTPIWKKSEAFAEKTSSQLYVEPLEKLRARARHDGETGAEPEEVARAVTKALLARRPPLRIAVVRARFMNWILPRLLPARFLDNAIGEQLGMPWKES